MAPRSTNPGWGGWRRGGADGRRDGRGRRRRREGVDRRARAGVVRFVLGHPPVDGQRLLDRPDPHQRVAELEVRLDDAAPVPAAVGQLDHFLEVADAGGLEARQFLRHVVGTVPVLEFLEPGERDVELLEAAVVLARGQQRLAEGAMDLRVVGVVEHPVLERRESRLGGFLLDRRGVTRVGLVVSHQLERRVVGRPDRGRVGGIHLGVRLGADGDRHVAQQRLLDDPVGRRLVDWRTWSGRW